MHPSGDLSFLKQNETEILWLTKSSLVLLELSEVSAYKLLFH
jgi:hypothetical protein